MPDRIPLPPRESRRSKARRQRKAEEAQAPPRKRGRPVGSKNRRPPTEEMFRGEADEG